MEGEKRYTDLHVGDKVVGADEEHNVIESEILDIYEYDYHGELHEIKSGRFNLFVTPNHEVYHRSKGADNYAKKRADSISSNGHLLCRFTTDNSLQSFNIHDYLLARPPLKHPAKSHRKPPLTSLDSVKLFKLIGYYIADGSPLKSRNSVYPTIRHGRKIRKLECLVNDLGLDYSIYEGSKIVIFHDDLGRYLLRCGEGASNKQIPEELLRFDIPHLQSLYDGLMECDAHKNGFIYYTTSEKLRTQFGILCMMLGKKTYYVNQGKKHSSISGREICAHHDCYQINISHNPAGYYARSIYNHKRRYEGTVWCLKTTSGNFFTVRGGIYTLSGNSGKTQICFTLAVMSHLPAELGGFGGNVVVIDTENTFKPHRLYQIAEVRGISVEDVMGSVLIARAVNSEHLAVLVNHLHEVIQDRGVKLVIIDSVISHFRSEYVGRGTLSERQQTLGRILGTLLRIAGANDVAVVLTNQMVATPDAMYSNPNKPTGGHIMGHAGTIRGQLSKGSKNTRFAAVIDSPDRPYEKVRIALTEAGVEDAE